MAEQPNTSKGTGKVKPAQDVKEALASHEPWMPVSASPEDVGAIQAMWRGDAQAHQQKRALELILRISRNDGALFFPGEDGRRSTDFALGRAFVGEQLITILKFKLKPGGEQS